MSAETIKLYENPQVIKCSFCGRPGDLRDNPLIANKANNAFICKQCLALAESKL